MTVQQNHEPHMLRSHIQEWCGGTEPPTMVTAVRTDEVRVDIFTAGTDIHDGYVHASKEAEIFLINNKLTPDTVGRFALRALRGKGSN